MPALLIKNGTILDPSQSLEAKRDPLLRDGKVETIGESLTTNNALPSDSGIQPEMTSGKDFVEAFVSEQAGLKQAAKKVRSE